MDDFQRALKNNRSKCFDCDSFRWCKDKVWVGRPKKCSRRMGVRKIFSERKAENEEVS